MPEIRCRACGQPFLNWDELARHIAEKAKLKDGRHKNTKWVKSRIHKKVVNALSKPVKKDYEPPTPLTESQIEAKHEAKYTLSGDTKYVPVRCPRCKVGSRQFLEVEHVNCPEALIIENCYVKICESCR